MLLTHEEDVMIDSIAYDETIRIIRSLDWQQTLQHQIESRKEGVTYGAIPRLLIKSSHQLKVAIFAK